MGWLPRGVSIFDDIAFGLKVGEIGELFGYRDPASLQPNSPVYYFIIMVSEKSDAREVDESYMPILKSNAFREWLKEESSKHQIKYSFNSEIYAWMDRQLKKNRPDSGR